MVTFEQDELENSDHQDALPDDTMNMDDTAATSAPGADTSDRGPDLPMNEKSEGYDHPTYADAQPVARDEDDDH